MSYHLSQDDVVGPEAETYMAVHREIWRPLSYAEAEQPDDYGRGLQRSHTRVVSDPTVSPDVIIMTEKNERMKIHLEKTKCDYCEYYCGSEEMCYFVGDAKSSCCHDTLPVLSTMRNTIEDDRRRFLEEDL